MNHHRFSGARKNVIPTGWNLVRSDNATPIYLEDAFNRFRLPQLQQEGRKKATIAEYWTAIWAWQRYWKSLEKAEENESRTSVVGTEGVKPKSDTATIDLEELRDDFSENEDVGEPTIGNIDQQDLAAFRGWYSQERDRSKTTLNRVVKSVRSIMIAADEAGAIEGAPKLRKLAAARNQKKIYLSLEHVDAIYEACSVAEWPTHDEHRNPLRFTPDRYWRAAVALYFNYGFRTQELIRYELDHRSLTWQNISFEEESPASEITNQHGWLWYVPEKQQSIKPDPLTLPLNESSRLHLKSIFAQKGSTRVFPFPRDKTKFYETWTAIAKASRVKPKAALSQEQTFYQIKDFRKTCATWNNFHNRGIAPFILGHASREEKGVEMTDIHYDNPERALVSHYANFPQPESFQQIQNENQLKLF